MNNEAKYFGFFGGKQSGKSYLGAVWIIHRAKKFPNLHHLITGPTIPRLKQSALQKFFEIVPPEFYTYKEHKSEIILRNGTTIFVRSVEDPRSIEGLSIKSWWGDEAAEYRRQVWNIGRIRLDINKGQSLFTTSLDVPPNWLYYEFYLNAIKDSKNKYKKNYYVIEVPSDWNKYFDKAIMEEDKHRLSYEEFARTYLGKFAKIEGLVYPDYKSEFVMPERVIIPRDYKIIVGLDFGFNDPSVAIFIAKDKDRNYYVLDEVYGSGWSYKMFTDKIKDVLLKIEYKGKQITYFADPSELQGISELAGLGIRPIISAVNDVKEGIRTVTAILKEVGLKINPKVIYLPSEFEAYKYPDANKFGVKKENPIDTANHAMDCIRYALYTDALLNRSSFIKPKTENPLAVEIEKMNPEELQRLKDKELQSQIWDMLTKRYKEEHYYEQ